jgi:hypothetical protein
VPAGGGTLDVPLAEGEGVKKGFGRRVREGDKKLGGLHKNIVRFVWILAEVVRGAVTASSCLVIKLIGTVVDKHIIIISNFNPSSNYSNFRSITVFAQPSFPLLNSLSIVFVFLLKTPLRRPTDVHPKIHFIL